MLAHHQPSSNHSKSGLEMVAGKRSTIINDDEPFDSFKRRQIKQAKTQNNLDPLAASELAEEQPTHATHPEATSSRRGFRPKSARVRPSTKINSWQTRIEQSFATGKQLNQPELGNKSTASIAQAPPRFQIISSCVPRTNLP